MKLGAGALIIAVGIVILWLAVTGKLGNVQAAWRALSSGADFQRDLDKARQPTAMLPTLPDLGSVSPLQDAARTFNVPLQLPVVPSFN